MSEKEHPRLILHNFLSPAECKELELIHKSSSTIGYRPNVFSTTLSHLIATNSPHLIIPFVSIRERLKEKIEETFGCEYELFIEFTGLISWCKGASIGWHSDDNRSYLKQRDFASGEPVTVAPSAGDVIMYTADDRNIHSVDEVTDGERLTLALWFSRDSSHDEDSKLLSRLSQCFDVCVARLHLLGFDVHSLQGEDHSTDASEQLMGPLQLAKGGKLLTRKFANILHALQVVQFYHWKASELVTSNVENDTLEEVKAMSHSQLETINALKSVFLLDENLVATTFGYSCSGEDRKDSLDLTGIALAVTSWEEYSCKLLKELLSSLPQWKTYQTIHKVESD
ncbi:unnamed protein product [Arabidopsis thaliana]|uniref:2-oxoglutarate (2OG) and Fe(II)-dependent oxygenase superfamily protein n=2 Tax=Arabidopsis thaliana TaxID=3702 RepID=Q45GM2_ARATH|nr:2-oxoglutarate (2OG) and Fe(II)-dependent oxygenase superfamily protein [Arabidopsis thaliana]AAZ52710.1 expressed protein [Arabidopsis thaliana]AEE34745.1 2-oxoglutarate (2OG) and Fe(II)-dependent oxygenase superfamily protein [Arabidopsis thaliana]CAD5316612.1 unnamed protein product [Arabidopsis thaliana]|eukprot:NP_001077789.1 2-oxoglutarate (2OG) and Fe(II)-dependent oxygenase superfamily protein [Arabidopsis thaliana]